MAVPVTRDSGDAGRSEKGPQLWDVLSSRYLLGVQVKKPLGG